MTDKEAPLAAAGEQSLCQSGETFQKNDCKQALDTDEGFRQGDWERTQLVKDKCGKGEEQHKLLLRDNTVSSEEPINIFWTNVMPSAMS